MTSEKNTALICSECGERILPDGLSVQKPRKTYCRECWTYYIGSRFRKRLFELGRPSKGSSGEVFRPAEPVLIIYDGSPSSVALINLIRDALICSKNPGSDTQNPRNLPFPFKFAILVILESDMIAGNGMVERQIKHLKKLYTWVKETETTVGVPFPLIITSIEMAVPNSLTVDKSYMKCKRIGNDNWSQSEVIPRYPLPVEGEYPGPNVIGVLSRTTLDNVRIPVDSDSNFLCMKVLQSLEESKTSQKDFLTILKSNLIIEAAEQLQVYKLILPEDQTALAIKMFSMMSLGRGSQVADQMSFVSESHGITLGRPLMDFSSDDLRQYLDCLPMECIEGLFNTSSSKKRKMKIDTVDRQCDDFIVELQRGYPSTVSTLTRIGGKLQPSSVPQTTHTSSQKNYQLTTDAAEAKCTSCKFCKRHMEESDWTDLCYGCSHILKDMKEPEKLWALINYYQPTYAVVESTEQQKLDGEEMAAKKKVWKESVGMTTNYKGGEIVKVTTYKGSKVTGVWEKEPSEQDDHTPTINENLA